MALTVTEKWICERVNLKHDNLDDVKSLSLPGSYHEKISHLGNSLKGFTRLKHLDLSRNDMSVLDGLEHLRLLETLNLYYNNISTLKELYKLRHNSNLKEIDIRLNPVTKNEPDYRLFVIHMIPTLKILDDRSVRDSERKAALAHFNTDQASQFDESPPKQKSKQDLNQTPRHPRSDLVNSLSARPSVLDDDDVALIDLMSKADIGRKGKSKYHAETYDSQELKRLPSPNEDKFSYYRDSDIDQHAQHHREKQDASQMTHESYNTQDAYYEHQPFVSNGNFTPNPQNGGAGKINFISSTSDDERYVSNRRTNGREGAQNDAFSKPEKITIRSQEINTRSLEDRKRGPSRENVSDSKQSRQIRDRALEVTIDKDRSVRNSVVSYNDGRNGGLTENSEDLPNFSKKAVVGQEPTSDKKQDLLWSMLVLVDKYWNGSGSLQTNAKFQTIASELISKCLTEASATDGDNVAVDVKREKEMVELRAQLYQKEAENERIKKRLHNEDEIQRTIEMADQDLRRLQTRIEDMQAENKALKAKYLEADAERKSSERSRHEIDELRRIKDALERENQTLGQQCEQQTTTLSQLQELTSMLQESHRSLVVTNDHLLQELDETRQRHQQEVQQLHWSYEQLKKTADWLPRSGK